MGQDRRLGRRRRRPRRDHQIGRSLQGLNLTRRKPCSGRVFLWTFAAAWRPIDLSYAILRRTLQFNTFPTDHFDIGLISTHFKEL
ncbi:hypothetical protein EMIT047CA2_130089 [Pseudomonas soli]